MKNVSVEKKTKNYQCHQINVVVHICQKQLYVFVQNSRMKVCVRYLCDQCDSMFTQLSHLTSHINSQHEGIIYSCNLCQYKTNKKRSLDTYHMKIVHAGLRYDCNQCELKTKTKSLLKKHIQTIHEGLKYSCDQCNHKFIPVDTVSKHKRAAHEGVRFNCHQCDYNTGWESNLSKHN